MLPTGVTNFKNAQLSHISLSILREPPGLRFGASILNAFTARILEHFASMENSAESCGGQVTGGSYPQHPGL